jgi:hypothetical protein
MHPAEMRHYLAEAATEVWDMMEAAKKVDSHGPKEDGVEGEAKL